MCRDTATAPYSWNTFLSCWVLLCLLSVLLALLPAVSVILLGSCAQNQSGHQAGGLLQLLHSVRNALPSEGSAH